MSTTEEVRSFAPPPALDPLGHAKLNYYLSGEGYWCPRMGNSNLSEKLYWIFPRPTDLDEVVPFSVSVYNRIERVYQIKTGFIAHSTHQLSEEEYVRICKEVGDALRALAASKSE